MKAFFLYNFFDLCETINQVYPYFIVTSFLGLNFRGLFGANRDESRTEALKRPLIKDKQKNKREIVNISSVIFR